MFWAGSAYMDLSAVLNEGLKQPQPVEKTVMIKAAGDRCHQKKEQSRAW